MDLYSLSYQTCHKICHLLSYMDLQRHSQHKRKEQTFVILFKLAEGRLNRIDLIGNSLIKRQQ